MTPATLNYSNPFLQEMLSIKPKTSEILKFKKNQHTYF